MYITAGYYGVQLFFCLSGYLITRILLDCRDIRDAGLASTGQLLGRFYGRRALRLVPALWLALAVGAFYLPEVRESWHWHLTYLSNLYFIQRGEFQGAVSHLWTLAVEEQFYLVWPLLVLGLARWKLKPLIIVLVVAAPLSRFLVAHYDAGLIAVYTPPLASADALGIGALLALSLRDPARVRNWCLPIGLVASLSVRLMDIANPWHPAFAGLSVSILSAGLVAGCIAGFPGTVGRVLESRPVVGLGRISYGVYVYHLFVAAALPEGSGVLYFLYVTSLCIAIAWASWRWVEQPTLRLKKYLAYSGAGSPVASGGRLIGGIT